MDRNCCSIVEGCRRAGPGPVSQGHRFLHDDFADPLPQPAVRRDLGTHHVKVLEVLCKADLVEQRDAAREGDEQVEFAVRAGLSPGDRAEDADVGHAVAGGYGHISRALCREKSVDVGRYGSFARRSWGSGMRASMDRPVLPGVSERLEIVDAPAYAADLARCLDRGNAMKDNRIRIVADRPMEAVEVQGLPVNAVNVNGLTVERWPPAPAMA